MSGIKIHIDGLTENLHNLRRCLERRCDNPKDVALLFLKKCERHLAALRMEDGEA